MSGFKESNKKINFFSVGEKNQWEKKLTKEQVLKIEEKFNRVMKKFNYKLVIFLFDCYFFKLCFIKIVISGNLLKQDRQPSFRGGKSFIN